MVVHEGETSGNTRNGSHRHFLGIVPRSRRQTHREKPAEIVHGRLECRGDRLWLRAYLGVLAEVRLPLPLAQAAVVPPRAPLGSPGRRGLGHDAAGRGNRCHGQQSMRNPLRLGDLLALAASILLLGADAENGRALAALAQPQGLLRLQSGPAALRQHPCRSYRVKNCMVRL